MIDENDSLLRLLGQIIRVGRVSSVDATKATVKVTFAESSNLVSQDLPVLQAHGGDLALPAAGEAVVCLFLPLTLEVGFVLGTIYSGSDAAPSGDATTRVVAGAEVLVGSDAATLEAARRTDPVARNAALAKWMLDVETALKAVPAPSVVPPLLSDAIGVISAGSAVVKVD